MTEEGRGQAAPGCWRIAKAKAKGAAALC